MSRELGGLELRGTSSRTSLPARNARGWSQSSGWHRREKGRNPRTRALVSGMRRAGPAASRAGPRAGRTVDDVAEWPRICRALAARTRRRAVDGAIGAARRGLCPHQMAAISSLESEAWQRAIFTCENALRLLSAAVSKFWVKSTLLSRRNPSALIFSAEIFKTIKVFSP